MNNDQQIELIDELFREPGLTVVLLRQEATIENGEQLYDSCKEQITQLRERLTKEDYAKDVVDQVSYALCALLDETVLLCNKDKGHNVWQGVPLQVVFFNSYNAGDEVFERIQTLLKQKDPLPLLVASYERILGLGFQGRHLGKTTQERDKTIIDIEALLTKMTSDALALSAENNLGMQGFWRNKSLFFWAGCSIAATGVIYLLLQQQLAASLRPFFSGL